MKTCSKCKIEKPRSEFSKKTVAKDGLAHNCKLCAAEYLAAWRIANPEKSRESSVAWANKNPARKKETNKAWRVANKEKISEKGRKYREENPERIKAYGEKYRAENSGLMTAYAADRRKSNPQKVKDQKKKWAEENPEALRTGWRNRRARKRNAPGKLSKDISGVLFHKQNGRCIYCQVDLTTVVQHLDHIMPLSRGGSNTDDNVQLLCARCNLRKNDKDPNDLDMVYRLVCGI